MTDATAQAIYFYDRHPMSGEIIKAKLQAARGHLKHVTPEELWPHDQDHYGGIAATDALAQAASIGPGTVVADFCAGLGGTVRYLAHRYGADVTGIELTSSRAAAAQELIALVGLGESARVRQGNVMEAPLGDGSIDVVVSQEALCHVPDRRKTLAEAFRVLRSGGRLAMTDWIANTPLSPQDAKLMWDGMGPSSRWRRCRRTATSHGKPAFACSRRRTSPTNGVRFSSNDSRCTSASAKRRARPGRRWATMPSTNPTSASSSSSCDATSAAFG